MGVWRAEEGEGAAAPRDDPRVPGVWGHVQDSMHELLKEFGLMLKAEELRSWGIVQEADLEKVDENFLRDPKINLVTVCRLRKMKAAWDARKTALVQ